MSTFDVRHTTGNLLVHLSNESFGPQVRSILKEVVPTLPHGEVTQARINFLRQHSARFPKIHMPFHKFGAICIEVVQPANSLRPDVAEALIRITGALDARGR